MSFTRYLTPVCAILAALSAVGSALPESSLNKRSALLQERQGCTNPSWIPACPGPFACIPPGGICCSDGISYAQPPETCPDGTQPIATAVVSSSTTPPPATITPAPTTTSIAVDYVYFTTYFTYYYWFYYYTYIAIDFTTALTSTQVTTVTTVSVSATDSAAAALQFSSLSATLAFPTPTQAATSLSGTPGPATPTPTAATTTTSVEAPTANASSAPQFTGAASSLRAGGMVSGTGAWAMGVVGLVCGGLMVLL